ncbi:MAG: hypothetical protein JW737_03695 [Acidobacteria bacterium]|nr:hypothetical protein [Acidobacteriota bacterium]
MSDLLNDVKNEDSAEFKLPLKYKKMIHNIGYWMSGLGMLSIVYAILEFVIYFSGMVYYRGYENLIGPGIAFIIGILILKSSQAAMKVTDIDSKGIKNFNDFLENLLIVIRITVVMILIVLFLTLFTKLLGLSLGNF